MTKNPLSVHSKPNEETGETDWSKPKDISDLDVAFPANICGKYLPPYSIVPEEFKRGKTYWNDRMNEWFFKGLNPEMILIPKDGIDKQKALRQLKACLGSFEPKHEHKEAGVAYLMSLFFVKPSSATSQ